MSDAKISTFNKFSSDTASAGKKRIIKRATALKTLDPADSVYNKTPFKSDEKDVNKKVAKAKTKDSLLTSIAFGKTASNITNPLINNAIRTQEDSATTLTKMLSGH